MNLIFSIFKYIREKNNMLCKVEWLNISYWDRYEYYLVHNTPIVGFKDRTNRVGNFFYAYPNINLQMTFYASIGTIDKESSFKRVTKLKWFIVFLKRVRK